jgi:DNA-binding transcriptional LysR family regulator
VARKIAGVRIVVCASPAYLKNHGTPHADLQEKSVRCSMTNCCLCYLRTPFRAPGWKRKWRLQWSTRDAFLRLLRDLKPPIDASLIDPGNFDDDIPF